MSRRCALARTGVLVGAAFAGKGLVVEAAAPEPTATPTVASFRYCLNMATLRGHKLGIVKEIQVAAEAGYDALEPWVDALQEFTRNGGALRDLKQRILDAGLTVEGAIGFAEWIVDDDARRSQGLERAKRDMDLVAQIGGRRLAAPPAGATGLPKLDLAKAAERYRALLEAGQQIGLAPILELWGFSQNLGRLGECVAVAMETGHPAACVLPDVFHLHKGGSDVRGLRLLGPAAVPVLHLNDYHADVPREKVDDSARVYPGDGGAPLTDILRLLHGTGGAKVLSLELFNRKYWAEDALAVAKTGLARMKAAVAKAGL